MSGESGIMVLRIACWLRSPSSSVPHPRRDSISRCLSRPFCAVLVIHKVRESSELSLGFTDLFNGKDEYQSSSRAVYVDVERRPLLL